METLYNILLPVIPAFFFVERASRQARGISSFPAPRNSAEYKVLFVVSALCDAFSPVSPAYDAGVIVRLLLRVIARRK